MITVIPTYIPNFFFPDQSQMLVYKCHRIDYWWSIGDKLASVSTSITFSWTMICLRACALFMVPCNYDIFIQSLLSISVHLFPLLSWWCLCNVVICTTYLFESDVTPLLTSMAWHTAGWVQSTPLVVAMTIAYSSTHWVGQMYNCIVVIVESTMLCMSVGKWTKTVVLDHSLLGLNLTVDHSDNTLWIHLMENWLCAFQFSWALFSPALKFSDNSWALFVCKWFFFPNTNWSQSTSSRYICSVTLNSSAMLYKFSSAILNSFGKSLVFQYYWDY